MLLSSWRTNNLAAKLFGMTGAGQCAFPFPNAPARPGGGHLSRAKMGWAVVCY